MDHIRLMLCCGCSVALAACGGGGGGSEPAPPAQWQAITNPNPGFGFGTFPFTTCNAAIVAPTAPGDFGSVASVDQGATWQTSPLGAAIQELDNGNHYWGRPSPFPVLTKESFDCGMTWTEYGVAQLGSCLNSDPEGLWHTNTSTLFAFGFAPAGTPMCGSSDGGQTWLPQPSPPGNIYAVRASHWFAIQFDASSSGIPLGHLFRSDDQGQTWQATSLQSANYGLALISRTSFGPIMYVIATTQNAGSVETLWRWSDATATWIAAPPFPWAIPPLSGPEFLTLSLVVNPANTSEIFLSFDQRVFESHDAGTSWTDATNALPSSSTGYWSLLFDPTVSNRLYAAMSLSSSGNSLYFAIDLAH
jgi:hypothetical protein